MRNILPALVAILLLAACGGADQPAADQAPADGSAGAFNCDPSGDPPRSFDAPGQVIEEGEDYVATITLQDGDQIVLELYPEAAPITVNNFVFLACQGFYDGTTFHRVLPGFMAQGGDPTDTGTGGPGYTIAHEADNGILFDEAGLISMAHTGRPNSTGSQFFITYGPAPHLDADFTVFGRVISGMEHVQDLTPRDPRANPSFSGDVIQSIRVEVQ